MANWGWLEQAALRGVLTRAGLWPLGPDYEAIEARVGADRPTVDYWLGVSWSRGVDPRPRGRHAQLLRILALSHPGEGDWPIRALAGDSHEPDGRGGYRLTAIEEARWRKWARDNGKYSRNQHHSGYNHLSNLSLSTPPTPPDTLLWELMQGEMRAAIPRGVCRLSRSGRTVIFTESRCGRHDLASSRLVSIAQLRQAGLRPWGVPPVLWVEAGRAVYDDAHRQAV